jgi:cardiolipin synthase
VHGNRAQILLNDDEIFPAMLAAIGGAKTTITFANFLYEEGNIARDMAEPWPSAAVPAWAST